MGCQQIVLIKVHRLHMQKRGRRWLGFGSIFCHFVKFTPYSHIILPYAELLQIVCLFVCWLVVFDLFVFLFKVRVAPQITTKPQSLRKISNCPFIPYCSGFH